MPEINHFVFRNGRLIVLDKDNPNVSTTTLSSSTNSLVDQLKQTHRKEIEALRADYEQKLQLYQDKIKSLEKQLTEKEHSRVYHHDRRHTNLYDSKNYEESTTLTVDANSICHSYGLRSIETRDVREGLCEINSEFFINRSSLSSSEKNTGSNINESNYLNASEIVNNQNEISTSRSTPLLTGPTNLIKRLDRSEQLVNNIKKFLQIQPSKDSFINSRVSEQSYYQTSDFFAEEVMESNQQIMNLLNHLQLEREKELRQMKQHYEELLIHHLGSRSKDKIVRIEPWSHRKNWIDLLRTSKHKQKTEENEEEEERRHNLSLLCFDDQY